MENRRYRHECEDKFDVSENSQNLKNVQESKTWSRVYPESVNLEVTELSIWSTDLGRSFVVKDLKCQVGLASLLQFGVQSKVNLFRLVDTLASMPSALTFVWTFILFRGAFAFVVILVERTRLAINDFINAGSSLVCEVFGWIVHGKATSHGDRCLGHWN